jgi:hypothetical protein
MSSYEIIPQSLLVLFSSICSLEEAQMDWVVFKYQLWHYSQWLV